MEMQLKVLIFTRAELEKLENLEVNPPGDILIPMIRNLRLINREIEVYDEAMSKLVREIGEPTPSGGWMIPQDDPSAMSRYQQARQEALETDIDIDLHPLDVKRVLQAMKRKKGFEVPMVCLVRLDYLFDIENLEALSEAELHQLTDPDA